MFERRKMTFTRRMITVFVLLGKSAGRTRLFRIFFAPLTQRNHHVTTWLRRDRFSFAALFNFRQLKTDKAFPLSYGSFSISTSRGFRMSSDRDFLLVFKAQNSQRKSVSAADYIPSRGLNIDYICRVFPSKVSNRHQIFLNLLSIFALQLGHST